MKKTQEWGEFFPTGLSPFAYNETVAQEYYPLTNEEVLEKGWKWKEKDMSNHQKQTYIIPDNISEILDEICLEVLACKKCDKNYKIQKQELKFYKKINTPIPKKCPDCRHLDRTYLRNPRKLFSRNCDNCLLEVSTTFSPERTEKVFCEKCYLESVY